MVKPSTSNGRSRNAPLRRPHLPAAWASRALVLGLLLVLSARAGAQITVENSAVRVSVEGRNSPPQIILRWTPDPGATSYEVYRKAKDAQNWGSRIAVLGTGAATLGEYADNTVTVGMAYEYNIRKELPNRWADGYVLAGLEVPPTEQRGAVVLVVDATHAAYLATDLAQLESDLTGDGWLVVRHEVAPTATPPQVKALIRADYQRAPSQVKAVFLLGHVAVPYSGGLAPDGHTDHFGAWPADVYYGDMRGTWSDNQLITSTAARPENHNVPGDGKFDQTDVPTVDLQVGRVDLSRLPAFALPERDLLRRYLQKDHQFRHKQVAVAERGLIDDHFGVHASIETFANNGWRNFSPLFGPAGGITEAGYFSTLRTQDYLWAYACGGGTYTSAGGVGSTADFASGPVKCVFNMLFGSYFGDWDNPDNFLRAALAADGYTLTNCWAGRPNWNFHQMGLGETIGYCTRLSQVASARYVPTFGSGEAHVALLGDPTLRLHVVAPPTALTATASLGQVALNWTPSPEAVLGYYVYRATNPAGPFTRVSAQAVAAATFTDPAPLPGTATYLVRAIQLKSSASGSYYNLSQGVFCHVTAIAVPTDGTWLGTQSADWDTPANWSNGVVPTMVGEAIIAAGTPFAPTVGGPTTVGRLILRPQAQLTVAAGASLTVRAEPELQPAPMGSPPTTLVLTPGTVPAPGGRVVLLDHTSAQAGLHLPVGTALTVGNYAEVRLLGHFGAPGGVVSFAPLGRLTFAHDPTAPTLGSDHHFAGAAAVGVLAVDDSRETLVLNGAVQVLSRVENQGAIVTNGHLTLRSTLGQQAMLAPVAAGPGQPRRLGTYTGAVRVEVYLDGSRNAGPGYRHLAAPVTGATVGSLANASFAPVVNPLYNTVGSSAVPFPTVYRFAQSRIGQAAVPGPVGFNQGWFSPGSLTEVLPGGIGHALQVPAPATITFTGPPYTAASLVMGSLTRGATPDAGWHLLGNPYAAPLDWDLLVSARRLTRLGAAVYVFKSTGPYGGAYATYLPGPGGSPGIGLNGGTNILPVGQGFFVRTNPGPAGVVVFNMSDLVTIPDAPSVQRGAADTRPRLLLRLRNPARTLAHQTAICFQAGATAAVDADYDAPYLPGAGPLALTSASGGAEFSINGLPALTGPEVVVPLQLRAAAAGPYELAVDTLARLPAGYHAYLRDALTGTYTDLAATPAVAVTLAANALVAGRYAVVFSRQLQALTTAPAALAALVSLYPNPAHGTATLLVPRGLRDAQGTTVVVLNSLGQPMGAHRFGLVAPEAFDVPLAGLAPGLYTVRVGTAAGFVSRRLVVE